MLSSVPFIPGSEIPYSQLLARYIPFVPYGAVSEWLLEKCKPGDLILDPFGTSPHLDVEAARAGFRVVVTIYNPILRFLLELEADPPTSEQLNSALADLSISMKGNERLKTHIQSQYLTICNQCGREVYAEAYIWDRGAKVPSHRIYHCQNCFSSGQFPTTDFDTELSLQYATSGLHRARALERVTSINDPDRVYAEEALSTYLPRAVYVLFALINKFDQLPVHHQRPLITMLIDAFDRANTMWPHPPERYKPRKLSVLSRFRENNIWMVLENFVESWDQRWKTEEIEKKYLPMTTWPELPPPTGGICIFDGHMMDLRHQINKIGLELEFKAAVFSIPRPNQAYWTLSALWAGWLWGRESTAHYKTVLRRRRYDWGWHCSALYRVFEELNNLSVNKIPFLGLISEAEPSFLLASVIAGWLVNFVPVAISLRIENDQVQLQWLPENLKFLSTKTIDILNNKDISKFMKSAVDSFLALNSEPASFMHLLGASLQELVRINLKNLDSKQLVPSEFFTHVNNTLQYLLADSTNYRRFGGSEHSLEKADFWFSQNSLLTSRDKISPVSNSDQVESIIIRFLNENSRCTLQELDRAVCHSSTGLFTPENELVIQCVRSYGEEVSIEREFWKIRNEEKSNNRLSDIADIKIKLKQIGMGLDFNVQETAVKLPDIQLPFHIPVSAPIHWIDLNDGVHYIFFISTSGIVTYLLTNKSDDAKEEMLLENSKIKNFLVIPGSRSGLLDFKFRKDERLFQIVKERWNFIKFRHIRRLADNKLLRRENLDEYLALDPLANKDPQMPLL